MSRSWSRQRASNRSVTRSESSTATRSCQCASGDRKSRTTKRSEANDEPTSVFECDVSTAGSGIGAASASDTSLVERAESCCISVGMNHVLSAARRLGRPSAVLHIDRCDDDGQIASATMRGYVGPRGRRHTLLGARSWSEVQSTDDWLPRLLRHVRPQDVQSDPKGARTSALR